MDLPKIIIVGTGLEDMKSSGPPYHLFVETLLIDRTDPAHLHPLVYQVSQSSIAEAIISPSVHDFLSMQHNAFILMGTVVSIDRARKMVFLSEGHTLSYKYLVVVSGIGEPGLDDDHVRQFSPGVQTLVEALKIHQSFLVGLQTGRLQRALKKQNLGFVPLAGNPSELKGISPLNIQQPQNPTPVDSSRGHRLFEVQL